MRLDAYRLREAITWCSPLGSLGRRIRRWAGPEATSVGIATIRTLEDAGVRSLRDLATTTPDSLQKMGVRPKLARQIANYVRERVGT
jgi:hypothetical protein